MSLITFYFNNNGQFDIWSIISSISTAIYTLATIFLVVFAFLANKAWKKQVKYQKEINAIDKLVIGLNDYIQTLDTYMHAGSIFSEKTQKNGDLNLKDLYLDSNLEKEKINIDFELTSKQRELSKNFEYFKFYFQDKAKAIDDLKEEINNYRNEHYNYLEAKITFYTLNKDLEKMEITKKEVKESRNKVYEKFDALKKDLNKTIKELK